VIGQPNSVQKLAAFSFAFRLEFVQRTLQTESPGNTYQSATNIRKSEGIMHHYHRNDLVQGSNLSSENSSMLDYAILFELEKRCIANMKRFQLIEAIGGRADCLPPDMRQGLEHETSEHIQLLLLTARFIRALRQMRKHKPLESHQAN
jgi:hypothetical protein